MKKKPIKICCFSDTHGTHRRLKIPECDILIFGGDAGITDFERLADFNDWLGEQPAKYKIFVAGNHDRYCEEIYRNNCKLFFTNAIYLENESVQIEGIKFWGSPYSIIFNSWSFMADDDYLAHIWEYIPEKTDFVITHGPAFGLLDQVGWKNEGSQSLRKRIDEIKPKYHLSAHIHEAYGAISREFTTHINASILNERYEFVNEPVVFEYNRRKNEKI